MKNATLIVAGFLLGVAVTLLIRRDPSEKPAPDKAAQYHRTAVKPDSAPLPPSEPVTLETSGGAASPPSPAPKAAEPAPIPVRKPRETHFGRPPKPKTSDVVKAATWDDFYRLCKERAIRGETLEDLIFRRLGQELELESEKLDSLKELFQAEQQAATKFISDSTGGWANLERQSDALSPAARHTLYEEWKRQRNAVRDSYQAEYLKLLTYDKLNILNEHLRNSTIETSNSYSSEGEYHLIGGVGK